MTNTSSRSRRIKPSVVLDHTVLVLAAAFMILPVLMLLQMTTVADVINIKNGPSLMIGDQLDDNLVKAMFKADGFAGDNTGVRMLINSTILGLGFAIGKIVLGMMAAYAIVYFRMRFATLAFWIIFTTLLLPLEVRILPSYEIVQKLGMLNTFQGLIIPLIASATATFFFRQYFRSIPEELVEAARIDGAGPIKFFIDILLPQAFRNTLPSTINQAVITFKETSIVTIIGFFEVMASGNAAMAWGCADRLNTQRCVPPRLKANTGSSVLMNSVVPVCSDGVLLRNANISL